MAESPANLRVRHEDRIFGPINREALAALLAEGRVSETATVSESGGPWLALLDYVAAADQAAAAAASVASSKRLSTSEAAAPVDSSAADAPGSKHRSLTLAARQSDTVGARQAKPSVTGASPAKPTAGNDELPIIPDGAEVNVELLLHDAETAPAVRRSTSPPAGIIEPLPDGQASRSAYKIKRQEVESSTDSSGKAADGSDFELIKFAVYACIGAIVVLLVVYLVR